jgi:hypothetical protein
LETVKMGWLLNNVADYEFVEGPNLTSTLPCETLPATFKTGPRAPFQHQKGHFWNAALQSFDISLALRLNRIVNNYLAHEPELKSEGKKALSRAGQVPKACRLCYVSRMRN